MTIKIDKPVNKGQITKIINNANKAQDDMELVEFTVTHDNLAWVSEVAIRLARESTPSKYKFIIDNVEVSENPQMDALIKYLSYTGFEYKLVNKPVIVLTPFDTEDLPNTDDYTSKVRGFELVNPKHRKHPNVDIKIPNRGSKHSAGYDIYSPISFILEAGQRTKFAISSKNTISYFLFT